MLRVFYNLLIRTLVIVLSLFPISVSASVISEYAIKTSFIYNVSKFIKWQDNADTLYICVYGEDIFGSHIDALAGKTTDGRPIKVIKTRIYEDLTQCHIVYISVQADQQIQLDNVLKQLNGLPVLTIAGGREVINKGVMVGLYIESGKIRFSVNLSEVKRANIKMSSKLLVLASEVI